MNGSRPSSGASGPLGFGFMGVKWPRIFFLITLVQAIICLAFECYVFWKFQTSLTDQDTQQATDANTDSPRRTIPTFLTLFIFGFLYEMVIVWDALRAKNTIQVIGIYIALLKFDFFFFLGFTVQFLVIVTLKTDTEFGLTIAAVPITIAILLLAAWFTRIENKVGMGTVIVLYLGGLTYFLYKLVRIYQPHTEQQYRAVRKSLTAFAVITILLIICTIINCIICMRNFGAGLKNHLRKPSRDIEKNPDLNSINLQDVKPQIASRMTID
ncbi:hypothetical protein ColTof4_06860 [Colletotrichum tofieldiae]|nr:hypothetical protein ColTof3_11807 [Colletotrichum tofieldiae]GKT74437.1 hypothetical protein ColTof4_06860 [Colletotrichum tofieldiae]